MSLQRLLVYSPLAIVVAVCLAVRVTCEQTARTRPAPDRTPLVSGVQPAGSVETPTRSATKTSVSPSASRPPADVPVGGGLNAVVAAPVPNSKAGERPALKQVAKSVGKSEVGSSESAGKRKRKAQQVALQTPLRKPETWTPPIVYGPPLPPDRIHVQKQVHQLRKDLEAGRVTLVMETRDGEQLDSLEHSGIYTWPAPPPGVNVRSERQRNVLAGTNEPSEPLPATPLRLQLASRGGERERTAPNPADDPDFNPCALPPSPLLLHLLTTLAGHSTSARPLQVLSLLRPPYRFGGYIHVGPANPHSMGLAVDIGAYGGYAIRQSNPEACVNATLALLRDLPPGRYRLGLPKAPEGGWDLPPALTALLTRPAAFSVVHASPLRKVILDSRRPQKDITTEAPGVSVEADAVEENSPESAANGTAGAISALYGLYVSSAKPVWPFFPPPFAQVVGEEESPEVESASSSTLRSVVTRDSAKSSHNVKRTRTVVRFQNEAYAPEAELTDPRLRQALEQARKRGVDVVALFPDGADHIHIDVRQNP